MSISQARDSIARVKVAMADLLKQQSRERDNRARVMAKISELEKRITSASKSTSPSIIQGYKNQLVQPYKDLAKYDSAIADLEKKLADRNKELNRYQDSLDKELKVENQKQDTEFKKQQKQRDEEHRREVGRLKEITIEIERQNQLRSNFKNTRYGDSEAGEKAEKKEVDERFSPIEIVRINEKLDLVIDALDKLGYGQEIIFNELDEMRTLVNMNKKTWYQTLKGKLVEMVIEKTLDATLVPKIINALTNDSSNLLS